VAAFFCHGLDIGHRYTDMDLRNLYGKMIDQYSQRRGRVVNVNLAILHVIIGN